MTSPLYFTPPFHGTGEMLLWEKDQIARFLRKDTPEWNRLHILVESPVFQPRGFISYLPISCDESGLTVLSPSDFRTEYCTIPLTDPEQKKCMEWYAVEDNAVLPFYCFSLFSVEFQPSDIDTPALLEILKDQIRKKIIIEMQRGCMIQNSLPQTSVYGSFPLHDKESFLSLIDFMSIEDRLDFFMIDYPDCIVPHIEIGSVFFKNREF